ncbi:MAG: tRNA (adenosine(37)-N6)-dimethylallyltransferase MiaA [Burkholderia sp.]|nr:tRNA (adenosine(37)-N6)-dimethylallyltransferase MiaA [Burkholderia sp.]
MRYKNFSPTSRSHNLSSFLKQIITIPSLLGPTASGKTATALALSVSKKIEIISVDSALIYRGMDIGTAKPTQNEREQIPHHLIDIRDPSDTYSIANFLIDALRVIEEVISRGRIPLLVGGTIFYYRALIHGINNLPYSDPAVRAELNEHAVRFGWPALHAWLAQIDPKTAARVNPNDSQRINRALEVFLITRKPISVFLTKTYMPPSVYRFVPITLEPSNRSILHERITVRFDKMLKAGFVEEVESLRRRVDLHARLPAIRCIGYRQIWEYLEGKTDYKLMRDKCIFATRQLCKRQLTWLRSIPDRTIIDCSSPDAYILGVHALEKMID